MAQEGREMLGSVLVVFDIDGVVRDVGGSYRRALADTVEHYTHGAYRPSQSDIDDLKAEGCWNNDWEASQEMVSRYFQAQGQPNFSLDYAELVAFFQSRYRGPDPNHWTGYICDEPLLMRSPYLESLTQAGIPWGFFSGATRASARYVLETRLALSAPVLVAMEDAPGKPDPTGLLDAVQQLEQQFGYSKNAPVIYVGDTVADIYTAQKAQVLHPDRRWLGVGILPPHVQATPAQKAAYSETLRQAGAIAIFDHVEQLTPQAIHQLLDAVVQS